jgi:hypothetical protein
MRGTVEHQNRQYNGDADREAAREIKMGLRPHGHSTLILLANIAPKFELSPLRKFCSPSFWALAVPSFGRWKFI